MNEMGRFVFTAADVTMLAPGAVLPPKDPAPYDKKTLILKLLPGRPAFT